MTRRSRLSSARANGFHSVLHPAGIKIGAFVGAHGCVPDENFIRHTSGAKKKITPLSLKRLNGVLLRLERELDGLSRHNVPGDEHGADESAQVNMPGLAEEIGRNQSDDNQQRHELNADDGQQ
jgi:hypothetical protein